MADVDLLTRASLTLLLKIKKTSGLLKWFKQRGGGRFIPQKKTIKAYLSAAEGSVWQIWSITAEEEEVEGETEAAQAHQHSERGEGSSPESHLSVCGFQAPVEWKDVGQLHAASSQV